MTRYIGIAFFVVFGAIPATAIAILSSYVLIVAASGLGSSSFASAIIMELSYTAFNSKLGINVNTNISIAAMVICGLFWGAIGMWDAAIRRSKVEAISASGIVVGIISVFFFAQYFGVSLDLAYNSPYGSLSIIVVPLTIAIVHLLRWRNVI